EDDVALHHLEEAHVRGLVETVELLEVADELGIEPAGAAILARLSTGCLASELSALGNRFAATRAETGCGVDSRPLDARDEQLDRAAGGSLDDDEVDDHDPEQRWEDQQQAAGNVREHRVGSGRSYLAPSPLRRASAASFFPSTHQVSKPSAYLGETRGFSNLS